MNSLTDRAKEIFLDALELGPADDRGAFIDRACGADAALRGEVENLLACHAQVGTFLASTAPEPGTTPAMDPAPEGPGTVVGPYRLMEQVGEGGMGLVFVAEQREPVRRKVALKVIKPGMDTREVVARFGAERQALALMDHPNIAKVLDAGATPSGRPYFVMELVRGVRVTDYCDLNRLTVRDRLGLFVQVCNAIQHAHQKGVIHRDIKPGNVLVAEHDGRPVAKVIDFGVAKALGPPLTDKTVYTGFRQMVGTPLYMSPEQAGVGGPDVDTRADVYSLGVLLYELLTGTTPFDTERFRRAGHDEVRRIIREEEPARPSTRLSTLGQGATIASVNRGTDPRRLGRLCRGDLDWVVMRCLEKDRNRRYETASALAADVQRYLNDEPVAAGPPSAVYKLRKFVRRNRGKVAAAGVGLGLLVLAVVGLAAGLVVVDRERRSKEEALGLLTRQQDETNKALAAQTRALDQAYAALRAMTDDLVESVLARQPQLGEAQKAYLRKVVTFFDRLAREHGDTPSAWVIQGDGQWLVAGIRDALGERKEAEAAYRAALAARTRLLADSPDNPKYHWGVANCYIGLGVQLDQTGRPHEAEASFREAIALLTPLAAASPEDLELSWSLARSHDYLGLVLRATGRYREAEDAYRAALAAGSRLGGEARASPRHRMSLADFHDHLGVLYDRTGRAREAEAAYRDALAVRLKLAEDYPRERLVQRDLALSHHNLGALLAETGRVPDAEAAFRRSVAGRRRLAADFPLAPQHAEHLAGGLAALGTLLTQTGRARDAEEVQREALAIRRKLDADFPGVPAYRRALAVSHFDLGNVLQDTGRPKEGEAEFRAAIGLQTKLAADSPGTPALRQELARSHSNLGILLADGGRREEAEAAYREAVALGAKLTAEVPAVADYAVGLAGTHCNLGNLFQSTGRPADALPHYALAIAALEPVLARESRLGKARLFLRNAHWARADTLGKLNRHREALPDWDRALELSPPPQRAVQTGRALGLVRAGESALATRAADELLAAPKPPAGTLYDAACVFALAAAGAAKDENLPPSERSSRAERFAAEAVARLRRSAELGHFKPAGRVPHLKQDPDLQSLRERADYRAFVQSLEKGA